MNQKSLRLSLLACSQKPLQHVFLGHPGSHAQGGPTHNGLPTLSIIKHENALQTCLDAI